MTGAQAAHLLYVAVGARPPGPRTFLMHAKAAGLRDRGADDAWPEHWLHTEHPTQTLCHNGCQSLPSYLRA